MTDRPKTKEYREGYQDCIAYCMNTRAVANPYRIGGQKWHAYEAGWREGIRDAAAELDAEQDDIGEYDQRGPVTFNRGTRSQRKIW